MDLKFGKNEDPSYNDSLLGRKRTSPKNNIESTIPTKTEHCGQPADYRVKKKNKELIDINNDSSVKDASVMSLNGVEECRKSKRMKRQESEVEVLYCHQCKKIDMKERMYTCGNLTCRESYCTTCLRKNSVRNDLI
jgi:hypothetical protein